MLFNYNHVILSLLRKYLFTLFSNCFSRQTHRHVIVEDMWWTQILQNVASKERMLLHRRGVCVHYLHFFFLFPIESIVLGPFPEFNRFLHELEFSLAACNVHFSFITHPHEAYSQNNKLHLKEHHGIGSQRLWNEARVFSSHCCCNAPPAPSMARQGKLHAVVCPQ